MRLLTPLAIALFTVSLSLPAAAATDSILNLDVRSTGIFGHNGALGQASMDEQTTVFYDIPDVVTGANPPIANPTVGEPIDVTITYPNADFATGTNGLDLDGDGTANDFVTFTLRFEKVDFDGDGLDGGALRIFGQGVDTGFGNLNDTQVSVINVSGTTTDNGDDIVFDGFTEVNIGFGSSVLIDRMVEVNGQVASFEEVAGGFIFRQDTVTFATPTATIEFDNSGGNTITPGNFNGDGVVNAADYTVWRDNLGDPEGGVDGVLSGAGNGSGTVDSGDFDLWEQNFGANFGSGSVVARNYDLQFSSVVPASASVPEPTAATLLVLAALAAAGRQRIR